MKKVLQKEQKWEDKDLMKLLEMKKYKQWTI